MGDSSSEHNKDFLLSPKPVVRHGSSSPSLRRNLHRTRSATAYELLLQLKLTKSANLISEEKLLSEILADELDKSIYYMHIVKHFANEAYYTSGAVLHVLSSQTGSTDSEILNEFVLYSSFITNIGMGFSHFREFYSNKNKFKDYDTTNLNWNQGNKERRTAEYQMYESLS